LGAFVVTVLKAKSTTLGIGGGLAKLGKCNKMLTRI